MSDIVDDADAVIALSVRGARFRQKRAVAGRSVEVDCRACKHPPIYRPFLGRPGHETLCCPICLNKTEPSDTRRTLRDLWAKMNAEQPEE